MADETHFVVDDSQNSASAQENPPQPPSSPFLTNSRNSCVDLEKFWRRKYRDARATVRTCEAPRSWIWRSFGGAPERRGARTLTSKQTVGAGLTERFPARAWFVESLFGGDG
jgi:hypothetical protein